MKEGIQTQHYSKILLTNHDSSLANSPFRMKGRPLKMLTLSKLFLFIFSLLLIAPIAFMLKKLKKKIQGSAVRCQPLSQQLAEIIRYYFLGKALSKEA